jgi:ABC-type dipeptide/oligopeptide/nickel transport system permease component
MSVKMSALPPAPRPLVLRVALEGILPVILAGVLIALLTEVLVNRVDPAELRVNTLLMGSRPFRVQSDVESFLTAVGSSLVLLVVALVAAVLVGVPGGIAYAFSRNRPLRAFAWSLGTLGATLPAFFWAIAAELVMLVFLFNTGSRPLPPAGFGLDEHLILPAFALGVRPAAYVFRLTASAVEDIRHEDYVRTAVAKGLGERTLLGRHVLPNAAATIIASTVLGARNALSSLPVVEFVYIWGGAGLTFVQAIGARQAVLAAGLAFSFAIASALLNVGSDLLQRRARVVR